MTAVPRTLWVSNDFPPRAGGIEQFVGNLLARLPPEGVRAIVSDWPGAAEHDAALPYAVERLRRPLLPTPGLARRIDAAVAAHDPDVVVFGAGWPLGELGARVGRPTFALTHGHEAGLARVGLGPLVRRVGRRVDAVGVISGFTRRLLEPWLLPHTAVVDLPPGVDVDRFRPGGSGAAVRERHGIAPDAPLVVCVGRLVARKGQDVLVEAWPRVRELVPGARLLLAGTGPLQQRLQRRVAALGLREAVTLAGGVAAAELPEHHAAADLFAMPCRTRLGGLDVEGLGIVYLEAQACGVPVLAGDSGGAPEALVAGETGAVVDGTSTTAVAAAVAGLLGDRERLAEMGAAGRAFVERRYAWDVIAARLVATLGDLCER